MQLVKNVFLSRNKTIARKLEEMLIVWLIESNHLTSKERMFEVYLNIAEWGPMIYGAAEGLTLLFREGTFPVKPCRVHFYGQHYPQAQTGPLLLRRVAVEAVL